MAKSGWLAAWLSGGAFDTPQNDNLPPDPWNPWKLYGRAARIVGIAALLVGGLGIAGWYLFAPSYANWAAIVVAGDWRAHEGGVTEAFDNARRDVSGQLLGIGFRFTNLRELSVRPGRYADDRPLPADEFTIADTLAALTKHAHGGCLLYFTSHGTPQGMVLGNDIFSPADLAKLVGEACAGRPAIIIVSACYSGVYIPQLEGPDRVVITAARPDRTSFGCGQNNKYPYFDACTLEVLKSSGSFPAFGDRVRDCVAKKEQETNMNPPSEPQVSIGSNAANALPTWR